jgi:hypothetical protein
VERIEKRWGTAIAAWNYCSKRDTRVRGPWQYGEAPRGAEEVELEKEKEKEKEKENICAQRTHAHKADVVAAPDAVKLKALIEIENLSSRELCAQHYGLWVKHGVLMGRLLETVEEGKQREWRTRLIVCVGAPGTGKSGWASWCAQRSGEGKFRKSIHNRWWCWRSLTGWGRCLGVEQRRSC